MPFLFPFLLGRYAPRLRLLLQLTNKDSGIRLARQQFSRDYPVFFRSLPPRSRRVRRSCVACAPCHAWRARGCEGLRGAPSIRAAAAAVDLGGVRARGGAPSPTARGAARALLPTRAGSSCAAAACWAWRGGRGLRARAGLARRSPVSIYIHASRRSGVGCEVVNDLEGVRGLPRLRGALLRPSASAGGLWAARRSLPWVCLGGRLGHVRGGGRRSWLVGCEGGRLGSARLLWIVRGARWDSVLISRWDARA